MGFKLNFGLIPDSTVLPEGTFRFKVTKAEAGHSSDSDGKTPKLMIIVANVVVEPEGAKGLPYYERFTLGTDDDPEGELDDTARKAPGARNFKRLCKATSVPFGDTEDSDSYLHALEGAEWIGDVVEKIEPDKIAFGANKGQDNPYKGRVNNNTTGYWKLGEKEPSLKQKGGTTGAVRRPIAAAARPNGSAIAQPRAAADKITCAACPPGAEKIDRSALPAHAQQHLQEMQRMVAGTGEEE